MTFKEKDADVAFMCVLCIALMRVYSFHCYLREAILPPLGLLSRFLLKRGDDYIDIYMDKKRRGAVLTCAVCHLVVYSLRV